MQDRFERLIASIDLETDFLYLRVVEAIMLAENLTLGSEAADHKGKLGKHRGQGARVHIRTSNYQPGRHYCTVWSRQKGQVR